MAKQSAELIDLIDKDRERIGKNQRGTIEKDDFNHFILSPTREACKVTNEVLAHDETNDFNNAYMMGAVGFILLKRDRPEEAVEYFQKALRLSPLHRNYYYVGLGNAYLDMGKYTKAIGEYKKAADYDAEDLFAHIGLASSYALLGYDKEAAAEAMAILRIQPNFSIQYFAKSMPFKSQSDRVFWVDALQKAGLPN